MARQPGIPLTEWREPGEAYSLATMLALTSPGFLEKCKAIQPETLEKTERQLANEIRKLSFQKKFPRELGIIKVRFWQEYKEAQKMKRNFSMADVYAGVCGEVFWRKHVLGNPLHLAWLIHPPTPEAAAQQELIDLAMGKLRDVFDAPIYSTKVLKVYNKKTKEDETKIIRELNLPLVKEIHSILRTMQDRVHGSVLQRTKNETITKNLNINANANAPGVSLKPELQAMRLDRPDITIDDLQEFTRQLERTQRLLQEATPVNLELPEPDETEVILYEEENPDPLAEELERI